MEQLLGEFLKQGGAIAVAVYLTHLFTKLISNKDSALQQATSTTTAVQNEFINRLEKISKDFAESQLEMIKEHTKRIEFLTNKHEEIAKEHTKQVQLITNKQAQALEDISKKLNLIHEDLLTTKRRK